MRSVLAVVLMTGILLGVAAAAFAEPTDGVDRLAEAMTMEPKIGDLGPVSLTIETGVQITDSRPDRHLE